MAAEGTGASLSVRELLEQIAAGIGVEASVWRSERTLMASRLSFVGQDLGC
jgi:hypothetical protein